MAWYEMTGGGLPSGLQSDMDAVLNKKFGTSTTYPPTGWPDDVNLMGPLPEKTVSGAIANFSDGADDVPVKEAKFNFLPKQASGTPTPSSPLAIDGWTGLTGYRYGKNLIDYTTFENKAIGADGSITNATTRLLSPILKLKSGTYFIKFPSGITFIGFAEYNDETWVRNVFTNNSVGVTISPQTNNFRLYFKRTDNGNMILSDIASAQLEVGSTSTTYEAYETPTTYPVSWSEHGTIYGGYVDATRGKVVKTYGYKDLGELSWVRASVSSGATGYRFRASFSDLKMNTGVSVTPTMKCTILSAGSPDDTWYGNDVITSDNTANRFIIYCSAYANYTNQEFTSAMSGIYCAYPLATPVEYDITAFTPSTYLGSNNFYSDANGDTEITYRADISLLLNSLQNNRGLMMRQLADPEEIEADPEELREEPEEQEEDNRR